MTPPSPWRLGAVLCALFVLGCTHPRAQPPPRAATVVVAELRPSLTTPEGMEFRPVLVVQNPLDVPLGFERVDYVVDLFDQTVIRSSSADLPDAAANGQVRVPLAWSLGVDDLAKAKDGRLAVDLRGTLYPDRNRGLAPVNFDRRVELPLPRLPQVTSLGSEGAPSDAGFRVRLELQNPNSFAISVVKVDAFLRLEGARAPLVLTEAVAPLPPGQRQILTLRLRVAPRQLPPPGEGGATPQAPRDSVGGSLSCASPVGRLYVPLALGSK